MSIGNVVRSRGSQSENSKVSRSDSSTTVLSPSAIRATSSSRIRDPKLVTGVALVALSMILGTWVVSSADQRIAVWALKAPLAAGSILSAEDLVAQPVNLESVNSYVLADESIEGARLTRDIGTSELIPVAALAHDDQPRRLVTIPVGLQHGAASANRGDRVDVHVSEKDASGGIRASKVILSDAVVAEVGMDESGNSEVPVVLEVHPKDVPAVVGALRGGVVDLVRIAGGQAGAQIGAQS